MRLLLENASKGNKRCKLAIDIFIYRIRKYIGAYAAVMGGLDALVFTAGIGENAKEIRARAVSGLFSHLKKRPKIIVVATNEELMIAHQVYQLMRACRH